MSISWKWIDKKDEKSVRTNIHQCTFLLCVFNVIFYLFFFIFYFFISIFHFFALFWFILFVIHNLKVISVVLQLAYSLWCTNHSYVLLLTHTFIDVFHLYMIVQRANLKAKVDFQFIYDIILAYRPAFLTFRLLVALRDYLVASFLWAMHLHSRSLCSLGLQVLHS